MNIQAKRGRDVVVDALTHIVVRVQGEQWRIASVGGVAVWPGEHSETLNYFGERSVSGSLWTGKTKHTITVSP